MIADLRAHGIRDERVLSSMAQVPRQSFVPVSLRARAYEDRPLPIGLGQTISQPYMVARMLEILELGPRDRLLDIGTGSGYQAAVASSLCREVVGIEIVPELAETARQTLSDLGYSNVSVVAGDGSVGLPERGPYDAIVVAAGAPEAPPALLAQLREGGRLVIPVGDRNEQVLRRYRREGSDWVIDSVLWCMFVPLVGEQGWPEAPEAPRGTESVTGAPALR
jgi:protein-L-isoaspartate(D-aspartate) O-methyltransferase